jgi:L-ribulokinase
VINGGGIPQHNKVLNQVYANVLGKPVLVPNGTPVSLGSGIFALVAAKVFSTIEEAQEKMCLPHLVYEPESGAVAVYERLFQLYRKVYFALGTRDAKAMALGDVLPELKAVAAQVQG